jgi:hypothetical protein
MADRGIMFSAAMVQALLAGRKTQTRRLGTSPLRKCQVGDRLWVRETHAYVGTVDPGWLLYRATYDADCARHGFDQPCPPESDVRWTPSILMRRTASRLTLLVSDVRVQRLQAISDHDAMAEGIERAGLPLSGWRDYQGRYTCALSGRESFASLWDSLHDKPGERWQDNPELVALTFTVCHGNIDQIGAR